MNPRIERSACAKVILCGEHAVVYGRPAIALPLSYLRARAAVERADHPLRICAPDIHAEFDLSADNTRPLAVLARLTLDAIGASVPNATLTITSDIPAASHLGSSAAVAVACARGIAAFCGRELQPSEVSALAYEAEKIYHGSPSGIDNTVVAYEQPVWFQRPQPGAPADALAEITPLPAARAPLLVIGDTGITTPTRIPVAEVRAEWLNDPQAFDALFDRIAQIVTAARDALAAADWQHLGALMNDNHNLLRELGVSCAELDHLCQAARDAGALGAKLSGGGRGGNMIALARDEIHAAELRAALHRAGAARVI